MDSVCPRKDGKLWVEGLGVKLGSGDCHSTSFPSVHDTCEQALQTPHHPDVDALSRRRPMSTLQDCVQVGG